MSRGDFTPGGAFLVRPGREFGKPVCRLGPASHGSTAVTAEYVLHAVSRLVNFLNWSAFAEGPPDDEAFPAAVASLGRDRDRVALCVQFAARTTAEAAGELRSVLSAIRSDHVDVVTLYYVEGADECETLRGPGGVVEYLRAAQADGVVRRLGVTSHQRPLAATMAASGPLDCAMVRYNAAHRGAERMCFRSPTPAVCRSSPTPPPGGERSSGQRRTTRRASPGRPPRRGTGSSCNSRRSVVLSAPHTRAELDEVLRVLSVSVPLPVDEYESLARHGERVRRHAGRFA